MIISRLFALLMSLVLLPAPMLAEITVMHELDAGEEVVEPAANDQHSMQHAIATPSYQEESHATLRNMNPAAGQVYKLNAGDAIAIRVFGEDSLNLDVVLDDSGVINYPFIGKIFVNGLSIDSLTQLITDGLGDGFLKDPHVNVSIVKYRPFFITGQINNPGSFPYEPGLTVKKAVSLAGGFAEMAAKDQITIIFEHSNGQSANKIGLNGRIHPGDTISVGESGYFFIDGEVKNPGRYPLQAGFTLRKAISIAGGYTEHASRGSISIVSNDDLIGRRGRMNDVIHAGDSITVDDSFF